MIPDHISFKTHFIIFLMNSHYSNTEWQGTKWQLFSPNLPKTVPGFGGGVETGFWVPFKTTFFVRNSDAI